MKTGSPFLESETAPSAESLTLMAINRAHPTLGDGVLPDAVGREHDVDFVEYR
ncbi:hypothetical protein A2U01_0026091 [Trifolium medium]|uniref:Uncharacterized protein n=1 Tax=Trifolium medium TaxID=97028 RepID=A0A392NZZ1_9FABA|nr:hypothetical protein [Trifolium medium]